MNSPHFQNFTTSIKGIKLPTKFTFPFYYEPHLLAVLAANEVQEYLKNQTDFEHNFGFNSNTSQLPIGKMFGVLVVQNQKNEIGYVAAFSGKLADKSLPSFFVPPIFNTHSFDSFYKTGEAELNSLSKQIVNLENDAHFKRLTTAYTAQTVFVEQDLKQQREKMKTAKNTRKIRRKEAEVNLSLEEFTSFNKKLEQESFNDQFLYKELYGYRESQLSKHQKEVAVLTSKITDLKTTRKQKSNLLQHELFNQYQFLNQQKEEKALLSIFPNFEEQNLLRVPAIVHPKLLQYAFSNDLKPIAMAEFWWGIAPNSEIRKHKNFYPSCQGRCKPILAHMLSGIEMDKNPLTQNTSENKEIEIIFEDDELLVINKPAELLSVPGKEIKDSVYTRIRNQYPAATGPIIVHRLDMSTSGILVLTKTKEANQSIQSQFINKTIKKRYVAVLDGIISTNKGIIELPLRVDLDDRPRQLVCYEHGKNAKTEWKVIRRENNTTRIHFYPITGRTHQLRVHASHSKGLNTPIMGDDLYGKKQNRLHLHADFIEFMHPTSNRKMSFQIDPEF